MKKSVYIRIIFGILIVVGIVGVISFWRFLGSENLKENLLGEWYYVEDTRCSILRISESSLELVYDISDPYCSSREPKRIEFVNNDTLRVITDRLYDDDIEEEFTLTFNEDKTSVKLNPPIIAEGYRGIWDKGKPSNKILMEVNNNKARENAEEIAKEQKFLQEVYSDPARHKGDLAITGVSGRLGSYKGTHHAIYFTGRIYNRSNQTIRNIEISCRSSKYSSDATTYIDFAEPNTYTNFECYSLVPYADGEGSDYCASATIIGYDE